MPPIVPLNTDPAVRADGPEAAAPDDPDRPGPGLRTAGCAPRPAWGLRIGLPALDLLRDLPRGVGFSVRRPAARLGQARQHRPDRQCSLPGAIRVWTPNYQASGRPGRAAPSVRCCRPRGVRMGTAVDLYPAWKQLAGRLKPNVLLGPRGPARRGLPVRGDGARFGIALSDRTSGQSAQLPGSYATVVGSLCAALPCVTDHDALLGDLERPPALRPRQAVTDRTTGFPMPSALLPVTSKATDLARPARMMGGDRRGAGGLGPFPPTTPAGQPWPPFVDGSTAAAWAHVRRRRAAHAADRDPARVRPGPMPVDLPATSAA